MSACFKALTYPSTMNLPEDHPHLSALHTLLEQSSPWQLRQTIQRLLFRGLLLGDTRELDKDELKDVELLLAFFEEISGSSE